MTHLICIADDGLRIYGENLFVWGERSDGERVELAWFAVTVRGRGVDRPADLVRYELGSGGV